MGLGDPEHSTGHAPETKKTGTETAEAVLPRSARLRLGNGPAIDRQSLREQFEASADSLRNAFAADMARMRDEHSDSVQSAKDEMRSFRERHRREFRGTRNNSELDIEVSRTPESGRGDVRARMDRMYQETERVARRRAGQASTPLPSEPDTTEGRRPQVSAQRELSPEEHARRQQFLKHKREMDLGMSALDLHGEQVLGLQDRKDIITQIAPKLARFDELNNPQHREFCGQVLAGLEVIDRDDLVLVPEGLSKPGVSPEQAQAVTGLVAREQFNQTFGPEYEYDMIRQPESSRQLPVPGMEEYGLTVSANLHELVSGLKQMGYQYDAEAVRWTKPETSP